jgi:hypothetical protein
MNDERLGEEISDFYRETDVRPPDSKQSAHEVAARLPHVEQVKRHRWRPSWLNRATPEVRPIPATNGHTPTVIGRTMTMLSPARTIITAALVFGVGGVYLIAQPLQQQSTVPGANVDAEPVWVTGNNTLASSCTGPNTGSDAKWNGVARHDWNYVCSPQTWTASDPRFSGEAAAVWNDDVYQTDNGFNAVNVSARYLQNDAGGWTCTSSNLFENFGLFPTSLTGETATCVGQGGYEGLSAILVLDDSAGYPFVGLIFPRRLPAAARGPGFRVGQPSTTRRSRHRVPRSSG